MALQREPCTVKSVNTGLFILYWVTYIILGYLYYTGLFILYWVIYIILGYLYYIGLFILSLVIYIILGYLYYTGRNKIKINQDIFMV